MKGQYLTVEYIIFFIIGISMVIIVYFLFTNVNQIAERNTVKSQLEAVGETIKGSVLNILEASSKTNSEINYNLTIPSKLSRCIYRIDSYIGLNLNCTHDSRIGAVVNLYNLNITTKNTIYSTKGYVEIRAYNGTVELR
jgi:hypothetical protein